MQPPLLAQNRTVLNDVLVRRQQDVELTHTNVVLQRTTLRWVALITDRLHRGGPLCELAHPICYCREGDDDEIQATVTLHLDEERDERNRLDGLSETLFK